MERQRKQSLAIGDPGARLAFYGRYSGNLQREASIEDQLREATECASRKGWQILPEYILADDAQSGQQLASREAFEKLRRLATQKNPPFDGIIIHDTSRFARNLTDSLAICDQLKFAEVFLFFVTTGLDSRNPMFRDMFLSLGRQDERYSQDLGHKTHRGQRGQVLKGYVGTGRNYGYRNVPIEHPTRKAEYGRPLVVAVQYEIVPEEAAVLRRMFDLYNRGLGVKTISGMLNSEGVPSTLVRGGEQHRAWRSNTIRKMLHNEKYIGRNIWNRTQVVLNPNTGRKEQRPRPASEWEVVEVPAWRIIPQDVWDARLAETKRRVEGNRSRALGGSNRTEQSRRYIFSGHLHCGLCGASMVVGAGSSENVRYVCKSNRHDKACSNNRTILKTRLEEQLLDSLAQLITAPSRLSDLSTEFERQLHESWTAQLARADQAPRLKKQLKELEQSESRFLDAIAAGFAPAALVERLGKIEEQKQAIFLQLAECEAKPVQPPSQEEITSFLQAKLSDLATSLRENGERTKQELSRRLGKLRLTPVSLNGKPGFRVEGDLELFTDEDAMLVTSRGASDKHCTIPAMKINCDLHTRQRTKAERKLYGVTIRTWQAKKRAIKSAAPVLPVNVLKTGELQQTCLAA